MSNTKKTASVAKKADTKVATKGLDAKKHETSFAFGLKNYILLIAGVVILFIGYICLAGGGSDDPAVFNDSLFNARRLVVAPILIVGGLIVEIFAIMIRPNDKKEAEPAEETAE